MNLTIIYSNCYSYVQKRKPVCPVNVYHPGYRGKLAADCLKAPEMRTVLHTASARVTESDSEANYVKPRCGLTQIPSFTQITKIC